MKTGAAAALSGLRERLTRHGQEHLLAGIEALEPGTRDAFVTRLAAVPWEELEHDPPPPPAADDVEAPSVVTLADRARLGSEPEAAGEAAYAAGQVAVLMVAGGEGTRLGFAGPKGSYPLAPHSGKTIYQLQAEKVVSLSRRVGRSIPLLVMTSPATDAETREFFTRHGFFGLAEGQARFFAQGTVPSVDRDGRALLAGPGELLENPDGHGGSLEALAASANLAWLQAEGVTHLVYFQVDNVLARLDDSLLVGLGALERADVVTKVLEKADAHEKVGHLVRRLGRDVVVEYTELTPEQARARRADGTLVYRWGSPALHLWSVAFLARLAERGFRPPLHRSSKPLRAWIDGAVRDVEGLKHERFVFDLLPEAERSLALEIERVAEFAPVKNATGPDSPDSAVELAHRQYVAWLSAAGVRVAVPEGDRIEISPLLAATREQFLAAWDGRVRELTAGCYLAEE